MTQEEKQKQKECELQNIPIHSCLYQAKEKCDEVKVLCSSNRPKAMKVNDLSEQNPRKVSDSKLIQIPKNLVFTVDAEKAVKMELLHTSPTFSAILLCSLLEVERLGADIGQDRELRLLQEMHDILWG